METINQRWHRLHRDDPEYKARKLKNRRRFLAKNYNLSLEQYESMVSKPCQICGNKKKRMAVDHCHLNGQVRGTLCIRCNVMLAWYEQNHMKIVSYLREV